MRDLLVERLRLAKRPDLERLLGDLKLEPAKYHDLADAQLVQLISEKLRSVAGNSIVNPFRRKRLPYKQILVDVADKLAPGPFWTSYKASGPESARQIEDFIAKQIEDRIRNLFATIVAERSEADAAVLQAKLLAELRRKGVPEHAARSAATALTGGTLSGAAVGPLVASMLFGSLWTTLFGLSLAQVVLGGVLVGGPVGVAAATLAFVTSPSYSKTIPALYRIILIRKNADQKARLRERK